jgi:hypothetical protein
MSDFVPFHGTFGSNPVCFCSVLAIVPNVLSYLMFAFLFYIMTLQTHHCVLTRTLTTSQNVLRK